MGLVIALVVLEVALRLFDREGYTLLEADELVGQHYRPGVTQERLIRESGRRISLRFNKDGYRGPDRPVTAPPGVRRIVVHGDSQVAAIAVEEEETLVGRLERRLRSEPTRWEVFNFGVSAYSIGQDLLVWRHVARRYRPELVILVFLVSNDVADNSNRTSSASRPYFHLEADDSLTLIPEPAASFALSGWLDANVRLYPWHKDLLRRLRVRLRGATGTVSRGLYSLSSQPDDEFEAAWRLTLRLLTRFRREVADSGAGFLLVIAPDAGQYDDGVWEAMLQRLGPEAAAKFDRDYPQRRLADFARRQGMPCLDPLDAFRRTWRREGPLSFGPGHWNVAGNDLAAELVHGHLVESGALESGDWSRLPTGCVPASR